MWLYVAGILKSDILSPDIDSSVLVGFPFAEKYLGFDGHPTTIYLKATASQLNRVHSLLAAQAYPEDPSQVNVSQPSVALTAKAAFNTLFLGLGAVALLVGAIGVANIMVISVLERRSEIGLRRALGATRGHIRIQFLSEATVLALIGGAIGVGAGVAATAIYAHVKGWTTAIPTDAWAGGLGAALVIGAGRPAARAQGRPAVAHRSTMDHLTARATGPGDRETESADDPRRTGAPAPRPARRRLAVGRRRR
jgi:putative ABC transport system permease protein